MHHVKFNGFLQSIIEKYPNIDIVELLQDELRLPWTESLQSENQSHHRFAVLVPISLFLRHWLILLLIRSKISHFVTISVYLQSLMSTKVRLNWRICIKSTLWLLKSSIAPHTWCMEGCLRHKLKAGIKNEFTLLRVRIFFPLNLKGGNFYSNPLHTHTKLKPDT